MCSGHAATYILVALHACKDKHHVVGMHNLYTLTKLVEQSLPHKAAVQSLQLHWSGLVSCASNSAFIDYSLPAHIFLL